MSQSFVLDKPEKPFFYKVFNGSATMPVGEGLTPTDSIQVFIHDGFFEDFDLELRPIQVVGDTIQVKERLLQDGQPYAFRYQGRDYMISKNQGRMKLYELKD